MLTVLSIMVTEGIIAFDIVDTALNVSNTKCRNWRTMDSSIRLLNLRAGDVVSQVF